jgi:hypothetical protein
LRHPLRLFLLALASACAPGPAPSRTPAPVSAASSRPASAPTASPSGKTPLTPAPADPNAGVPCGGLGCLRFRSAEAAFEHVLAEKPLLLALGEAHAQQGTESIPSTVNRFTQQLLPRLVGRARALVVELLVSDGKCGGQVEQSVAEKQRPVTEHQAASNQNEFLSLARQSKALGIVPYPLRPTCEEYRAITGAGAGDINLMLSTVRDASLRTLNGLLDATPKPGENGLILAYGGALHNDLAPRSGRESWSFGPALRERTNGRYVELDLIVPEYVKDTESWQAFPWYKEYQTAPHTEETLLYSPSPSSFVLIFPRSSP